MNSPNESYDETALFYAHFKVMKNVIKNICRFFNRSSSTKERLVSGRPEVPYSEEYSFQIFTRHCLIEPFEV